MQRVLPIFTLVITIFLFSCEKEHHEVIKKDTIAGTWDFISIDAQTCSITKGGLNEVPQKGTSLNYLTENNAGKLIINDSTITTIGLSYTISSDLTIYKYKDGVQGDTAETPYNLSFYQPQSVCAYKLIYTDSIYFPKGGFIHIPASALRTDQPGAWISFRGDALLFKEYICRDSAFNRPAGSGWQTPYHTIQTGTAIIRAVKHR